ncbi:MAG: OsmC family protein [Caldimonas sp.]
MTSERVAAAVRRVQTVLQRRPELGQSEDAPASARWQGATRVVAIHPNGTELATDMPAELGGSGDQVTPGWLFRAGFATCAATSIAITAAARGIALDLLEVEARSRSDTRGLLGMSDAHGLAVPAAPSDLQLRVRIAATGTPAQRLRALVEDGCRCSPIPNAVEQALPFALHVDVEAG